MSAFTEVPALLPATLDDRLTPQRLAPDFASWASALASGEVDGDGEGNGDGGLDGVGATVTGEAGVSARVGATVTGEAGAGAGAGARVGAAIPVPRAAELTAAAAIASVIPTGHQGLLQVAFAASSTPTCLVDIQQHADSAVGEPVRAVISLANAAFVRLSGWSATALAGADPLILTGVDSDAATVALLRRAIASGAGARVPVQETRADGVSFWAEVTVLPVRDATGTLIGSVIEHRDLSRELAAVARGWRGHHVDPTTGLAGRSLVEAEIARLCTGAMPFALLSCALTRLDAVNACVGEATGDDLLSEAARRLAEVVGLEGRVGRSTGASYSVILEGAGREDAHAMAERIERALAERPLPGGHGVEIAVGASVFPDDARTPSALAHVAIRSREQVRRLSGSRWARTRARARHFGG